MPSIEVLSMMTRSDDMPEEVFGFNSVQSYDRSADQLQTFDYGKNVIAEEHIFVAKPAGVEGQGGCWAPALIGVPDAPAYQCWMLTTLLKVPSPRPRWGITYHWAFTESSLLVSARKWVTVLPTRSLFSVQTLIIVLINALICTLVAVVLWVLVPELARNNFINDWIFSQ